ncbi:hypothetical protein L195_g063729, partial [Trifolium pratense]
RLKYLFDRKESNMRKRKRLGFLRGDDFDVCCHPSGSDVVADS